MKLENLIKMDIKKFVAILIAIVVTLSVGSNITIGAFSASIGNDKVIKAVLASAKLTDEKRDLVDNLKKIQLIKLDNTLTAMKDLFLSTHRNLLATKGIINDVFKHPEYISYGNLIEIGLHRMKYLAIEDFNEMLTIFTKPDNTEFSFEIIKKEFENYIGETNTNDGPTGLKGELISAFGYIIQSQWVYVRDSNGNIILTPEENFAWTRQIVGQTCDLIEDVYKENLKKQLDYQKQIKIKENEFKEYVKSL